MERPTPSTSRSLTQSLTGTQYEALRKKSDRLTESCHGQISTDRIDADDELTPLSWLSCLTPQNLVCSLDVDNVGAEEFLGSSMNSTTTDQSDGSQNFSAENSSTYPVSPLSQNYQRFLEERKRSEGDNRRIPQNNPVVMNHSAIMYDANPQQYTKPPLSFGALICLAIESSPMRRLPVKDIYMWIEGNFPYYKNASGMSWKNSVRHNLSLSKAFVKMPRPQPGGKGCLWGINDDYRNSLIASFRRSGLTYPLILPLNGSRLGGEDGQGGDRPLPEFYSQAALQRQQQPQQINSINHVVQHQVIGHCPEKQRSQQVHFFHPKQRHGHRARLPQVTEERDDCQAFMRDLRFFNQAIKRTQALMFKELIDEGEEEEEEQPVEPRDEIMEDIPLDNHGLTQEQIVELNHLARRGRRRKTPTFRHLTPIPSFDHEYCKRSLGKDDLYESETDNEPEEAPEEPPPVPPAKRQRMTMSVLHAAKRRFQERGARKSPALAKQAWLGHRRSSSSFHARAGAGYHVGARGHALARSGPASLLSGHEAAAAAAAAARAQASAHAHPAASVILPRRRRPGRPPKNRAAAGEEAVRRAAQAAAARKRHCSAEALRRGADTDSGSLADDEDFDDAMTEPMEDAAYGEAILSDSETEESAPEPRPQPEPVMDSIEVQAAAILLQLSHRNSQRFFPEIMLRQANDNQGEEQNGVHVSNAYYERNWESVGVEAVRNNDGEEDQAGMMNARSPENVPPPACGGINASTPKRRGRRPRKDNVKAVAVEKEKVAPLTPNTTRNDASEGNLSVRSGLPKRKAAVNAPAVWNKKRKMNK